MKDIQYSSRTRNVTDQYLARMKLAHAVERLLAKLPPDMHDAPEVERLRAMIPEARSTSCI
jgi:NTE family protein